MVALLALASLKIRALGSRQMWSFDGECRFSALETLYVLRGDGAQEAHTAGVSMCGVRRILVGLIGGDFLEEGLFLEQLHTHTRTRIYTHW